MPSKYDLHWVRVKPGYYRLSNGNFDVFKEGSVWNVYYCDLWHGRRMLIHTADSYSEGKSYAMKYHDKMQEDAIKRLGRK